MNNDLLWKFTRMTVQAIRLAFILAAIALTLGFVISLAGDGPSFVQIEESLRLGILNVDARVGLGIAIGTAMSMLLLAERFLSKINAILAPLPNGDPFLDQNADRLNTMAWLALAIQVLGSMMWFFPVEVLAIGSRIKLQSDLSIAGVVLVLLLFMLARIFRLGTEMRSDLEGTV
ncbi:MAG: DUF2975 domain-containing protein [Erythrobacter sp.]|uniref:DUF2975 domain-containing protein n=1 Tax=Erythrobacter sp. TaxID=1042 RepID=UPI0032657E62